SLFPYTTLFRSALFVVALALLAVFFTDGLDVFFRDRREVRRTSTVTGLAFRAASVIVEAAPAAVSITVLATAEAWSMTGLTILLACSITPSTALSGVPDVVLLDSCF